MAAPNDIPPRHTASPASISSEPLLEDNNNEDIQELQPELVQGMSQSQALNLYTSHFFSTWNVRTYEFAAIIFTAAAYPDTLVAIAIRGIIRNLSSICLSSTVGRAIDEAPDRFKTLVRTISLNRASVILASGFWCIMLLPQNSDAVITKALQFTAILMLGIVEGLSGKANMLSMERDWVPALKAPDGEAYDLTHLNAVMRRIDLVCKLVAPILISFVISYTGSSTGAIVVGSMSAASWGLEYFCAKRVWLGNASLRIPKPVIVREHTAVLDGQTVLQRVRHGLKKYVQDFRNYFSTKVWIPSMSLSLLHLSALSYGGVFVTFLLSAGFSLEIITIARAVGSIVEISSTVVTPVGVQYLGKAHTHGRFQPEDHNDEAQVGLLEPEPQLQGGRTETGLERLGLWGLSWQLFNLVPVVFALWSLSPGTTTAPPTLPILSRFLGSNPSQAMLALTLFSFLSLSRLGLWIFDLTTQQLTQTLVAPQKRSSFTGVEYSFVSIFELTQLVMAIAFPKPEQFWLLALMSFGAVATSTIAYAAWVRGVRGHLVHWERFGKGRCGGKR